MALDIITGDLLAYKELDPGTFQHSYQLTTLIRDNPELECQCFYTADVALYTVEGNRVLLAITREPQNLVLKNIDEAYRQIVEQGNYFPEAKAARASLSHEDTVVVDLKGLKLRKDSYLYSNFVINPKKPKKGNPEQRKVAQRIYGPDEENFRLNMEMFAKARVSPRIRPIFYILSPNYVLDTLTSKRKEFLALPSLLDLQSYDSAFFAGNQRVENLCNWCGVRNIRKADAPENEVPQETRIEKPTMEEILAVSKQ